MGNQKRISISEWDGITRVQKKDIIHFQTIESGYDAEYECSLCHHDKTYIVKTTKKGVKLYFCPKCNNYTVSRQSVVECYHDWDGNCDCCGIEIPIISYGKWKFGLPCAHKTDPDTHIVDHLCKSCLDSITEEERIDDVPECINEEERQNKRDYEEAHQDE